MNTYEITYNLKWQTNGRMVTWRTTYGIVKLIEANTAQEARALILAKPSRSILTITGIKETN